MICSVYQLSLFVLDSSTLQVAVKVLKETGTVALSNSVHTLNAWLYSVPTQPLCFGFIHAPGCCESLERDRHRGSQQLCPYAQCLTCSVYQLSLFVLASSTLQVAVKVLKEIGTVALGDFRTELNVLQKVHHPHTVRMLAQDSRETIS